MTRLAESAKENGGSGRPFLIALTGWGQDEDRSRSKEAGFDAHLVKPVDDRALTTLLARLGSDSQEVEHELIPPNGIAQSCSACRRFRKPHSVRRRSRSVGPLLNLDTSSSCHSAG